MLRKVGFFCELPHGDPSGPSLASIARVPLPDKGLVIGYLNGGSVLAATGTIARDVLTDEPHPIGPLSLLTDGVWVWLSDLQYYVGTYDVTLPEEFLAHARLTGGPPRELTREELSALAVMMRRQKM